MSENKFLGVDGCKAGWFFVAIGQGHEAEFGVFENIDQLFQSYSDARWILIDIPIGLPSKEIPNRICDIEARKLLGLKKASAVFSPPCREALKASKYTEAKQINLAELGKGLNLQTYHISKKIKEVDEFLNCHPESIKRIRESHPEICFWALAGQKTMEHNKKTDKGLEERLEILKQHFSKSSAIYKAALDRYLRKEVARDDILDAIALAVTATNLSARGATLPEKPMKDSSGLPMEIVYACPEISSVTKSELTHLTIKKQDVNAILVNRLEQADPDSCSRHKNVNCTYAVVETDGKKYLQIDIYGSDSRKIVEEKRQSIRLGPEAINQLKSIIDEL
jgi:predicted RNase H-like nuclease